MRINITGGNKHQKEAVRSMAPWIAKRLFPRQAPFIILNVYIKNLKGFSASTIPSCDYVNSPRPRVFDIEIHYKLSMRSFRECICHELTHVMQYTKGHMYDYNDGITWYKGKFYPTEEITNVKYEAYWTVEFEEEARGKERALYELYWKWKRKNKKVK